MKDIIQQVCEAFRIKGTFVSYEELKVGNINKTYRVTYRQKEDTLKDFIVQRINTNVFKDPVAVMNNIDLVTEYMRDEAPEKNVLHFHHTRDRKTYIFDEDGGFWRLFSYFNSTTYNLPENPEIVKNAGKAFGEFQMILGDFDASQLIETIPDFHNTRKRFEKMEADIAADPFGLVKDVQEEIDYILSVKDKACMLVDMLQKGELPLRVTHNDTKINNVLFEKGGTKALVVIDLDTVMPGLVAYDFGDAIRFAANFVDEDSKDYEHAGVNMEMYRAFAKGFLKRTARVLTENEVATLALGCFAITVEQVTRFLDDYIMGSTYFKTNYPEHNLVRTRCQAALAKDMEKKLPDMEEIVRHYVDKYKNR